MLCVFSSISSPGMMDLLKEVSVAFRQSDHSSASAPRRCNRCVGKLPPLGRKHLRRGVVDKDGWRCRAGEFLFAGDGSRCLPGDCSLLDTLLGPGTTLVEFPKFVFLRCLVSLPFRADVVDILIVGSQVDLPSNRRCDLRQETLHSVRWKPCCDELVSAVHWRCHVPGLAPCSRRSSSHVAIAFCPQGGLYVGGHMVFTNAMATFRQCGLANFQPAWFRRSELGKSSREPLICYN